MGNKRVSIYIKLATGNINVKGAHHKLWAENEFHSVKKCLDVSSQIGDENKSQKPTIKEKEKEEEQSVNRTEINLLWKENQNLKNAIVTIQSTLTTHSCQPENLVMESILKKVDEKILKAEEHFQKQWRS